MDDTEPIDAQAVLESPVLAENVDAFYDARIGSRQRRNEWPFQNRGFNSMYTAVTSGHPSGLMKEVSAETIDIVQNELQKCESELEDWVDSDVRDNLRRSPPKWYGGLCNLYWRARRQSAVWDCFELLIQSNLIDPRTLEIPMSCARLHPNVAWLASVLSCFTFVVDDENRTIEGKIPLQSTEHSSDVEWLALMIVRGAFD